MICSCLSIVIIRRLDVRSFPEKCEKYLDIFTTFSRGAFLFFTTQKTLLFNTNFMEKSEFCRSISIPLGISTYMRFWRCYHGLTVDSQLVYEIILKQNLMVLLKKKRCSNIFGHEIFTVKAKLVFDF